MTNRQDGQALVEYAFIIALVAIIVFASLQHLGINVRAFLEGFAGNV